MKNPLKVKDRNPMSINILKLQRYNFDHWTLEEIVFFEYLIIKSQAFGFKPFYHSSATIAKETGIKRTKLASIIKRFLKEGFIHIEVKGMPRVKYFEVDFTMIFAMLHKIYRYVESDQPSAYMNKLLVDFDQPLLDKYKQKNSNKHNKEVTLKETLATDNGLGKPEHVFFSIIKEIAVVYELDTYQMTYDSMQLNTVLNLFEPDIIEGALMDYFEYEGKEGSLKGFIQSMLNDYEERKQIEALPAKQLLTELDKIFNERRSIAKGKKYSKSSLARSKSLIGKVLQVLGNKPEQSIKNSFIAYIDAILKNEEKPKKILNYFFTYKDEEYPILDMYLDHFNCTYTLSKKQLV